MRWWYKYLYDRKYKWQGTSIFFFLWDGILYKLFQCWREVYAGLGHDHLIVQLIESLINKICYKIAVWLQEEIWSYINKGKIFNDIVQWFNENFFMQQLSIMHFIIILVVVHVILLLIIWIWVNVTC